MDAVGDEGGDVGKGLAVAPGAVPVDVELVDRGGRGEVAAVEAEGDARVGDVGALAVGGEGEAVGQGKVVGDDADGARFKVVAVDLVAQAGDGAEILEVAVECVREVDLGVFGADDNIVEGVELAAKVVVDDG